MSTDFSSGSAALVPRKYGISPGRMQLCEEVTSVAMNEWLRYATPAARIHLDPEHTVHGHRAGSATAAKKLKVDVAEICRVADWELTGKELNKAYYHRDMECEPHLSRLFFADLLA
jgi:hypothetical protein